MDKTRVVFRKFKDGEVIALFPDVPGAHHDPRYSCDSYTHVGQHGAADYANVVRETKPATPDEYASLRRELESSPFNYSLAIKVRR